MKKEIVDQDDIVEEGDEDDIDDVIQKEMINDECKDDNDTKLVTVGRSLIINMVTGQEGGLVSGKGKGMSMRRID